MNEKRTDLFWKIPTILIGVAFGLVLLVTIAAVCVLAIPSVRTKVLNKGVEVAQEKTGYDIDMGGLYLSPFHHSPRILWRAYKGEDDLPLQVDIDSLFVGHRGQDTLICLQALSLKAIIQNSKFKIQNFSDFTSIPIVVERLALDTATIHSGDMIEAVGIDVILNTLELNSPGIVLAEGRYPLHGLRLNDAFIGIDLRDTPPDTTAQDTTPLLMAFDVPDGVMRNVHFALTPLGMHIRANNLSTSTLADVGGNVYDARRLDVGGASLRLGSLFLPFDTLYGDAHVDLARNLITSKGLHAVSSEFGAKADLSSTMMNLETMCVQVVGDADYQGSLAHLRALYDIENEAYNLQMNVERVDLSPFLKDSTHVVVAGEILAEGKGLDPNSRAMRSKIQMRLTDCIYDNIDVSGIGLDADLADKAVEGNLHLPFSMNDKDLRVKAQTEHQFRVAEFMKPEKMQVDYHAQMKRVRAHVAGEDFNIDSLALHFATNDTTSVNLATQGLSVDATSPMHVLKLVDRIQPLLTAVGDSTVIDPIVSLSNLTMLDTIRQLIPELTTQIVLAKGSPVQHIIERMGLDINEVALDFQSNAAQTGLALDASIPEINHPEDSTALRLPAAKASMKVAMKEGKTTASLVADSKLTDGALMVHALQTDAALRFDLERTGRRLNGTGRLTLDSLSFAKMVLGSRAIDIQVAPSEQFDNAIKADVHLDDLPLDLVDSILQFADLDLKGFVRAKARADGLPDHLDLSAEVLPHNVSAEYKPYAVELGLGETPIVMEHNRLDLNGLPIYGVDSTFISLTGGLNLDSMRLDVVLAADSFIPAKLEQGGPAPVYGDLAVDIRGRVTGPLDSISADVDVTLLPVTDITYPIDKKNLAQVKPHGKVNVRYDVADGALNLGGRVNVDDGYIRYSPKLYPIMPFHVDSGSHVAFNGPLGQTLLNVSASQKVKADVQSEGEETRRVDFITGVRVNGVLDSIGLDAIGFFLEAPEDETITQELSSVDEDTREGLAATLLATGMYVGESNVSAQEGGYALTSIINSRINAALSNSKMGKIIDIDVSSGKTQHAVGETNDMNIAISKSFFKERLRITVGASISDNPEVLKTNGLFNNLTAEYKLTKDGNISLRAFAQRDYNNIFEGELYKSGIGVRATKQWEKTTPIKSQFTIHNSQLKNNNSQLSIINSQLTTDSITRTYGLTADADVAWRSNNSLGPNLTLTSTIKNLMGKGEILSIKGNGAYYWALRNRHPGDPKKTDTYKMGVNTSLIFPYLHWVGENIPKGDTRYMVGYQYENIAGGYGVHKAYGSFTYFIRSPHSKYITHAFTPFSLSVVRLKAESADLLDKASEYPQLIKVLASDEFVPSIGYTFTYSDYRSKRAVNTMVELGVKESGNLINAFYCIGKYGWNDKDKPLGKITFNQFVKMTAELRNRYNITDKVSVATRLFAGSNIPLGNSLATPLSEAFYAGGPNSMRACSPYAYGPGNFHSALYNQNFFHAGDIKLEANFELRFPIVWKLFGAAFVDAGNVWNWHSSADIFKAYGFTDYIEQLELHDELYDGLLNNPNWAKQIALGTGAGLRLDLDGLVIRLDLGVAIHAPYQTYKYNKDREIDYTQPITTYFNIPSALDALRLNFGIGYPF